MSAAAKPEPAGVLVRQPWDPFALMDRLDDEAIRKELEGIASDELVYVVRDEKGQEVTGLSKGGVDECCNVLAHRGEVIREEGLTWSFRGQGEEEEALFMVLAARYAVAADGREVKLDQVHGTKIQPLYYEAALPLTIDSPCPGKKPLKDGKRRTFRQMLEQERGYVEWMAENFRDEATAEFCRRLLQGEDVTVQPGRQKNRFWFEQGSQKAARNARFRLIGADIKAAVIARAKQAGKEKVVDQRVESKEAGAPAVHENTTLEAASKEQVALVFGEASRAGLTKETFPAWYAEVLQRSFERVYEADVKPLLDAAAKRIAEKGKKAQAPGAAA